MKTSYSHLLVGPLYISPHSACSFNAPHSTNPFISHPPTDLQSIVNTPPKALVLSLLVRAALRVLVGFVRALQEKQAKKEEAPAQTLGSHQHRRMRPRKEGDLIRRQDARLKVERQVYRRPSLDASTTPFPAS